MYTTKLSATVNIVDQKTRVKNQIEQLSFAIDLRYSLSDLRDTKLMDVIQKVNKLHVQSVQLTPSESADLATLYETKLGRSLHINSQCVRDVDNKFVTLNSTKWRISFVLSLRKCKNQLK